MAANNEAIYKNILEITTETPVERFAKKRANNAKYNTSAALSFQLMTRAEPPEMVIATIQSLLAIKSPDDEIIIIDNNHTNTSLYQPLAAFCASLDATRQVHFYHIDAVEGFKAGALNLALGLMNPNCTHLVVVDSDYQALPHARAAITEAIHRHPDHALLQFPQFYRNAGQVDARSELNHYFNHHLYRPFNRDRALSTGTYAVIRRSDLLSLGGWSGASITEDAQMGVLMHHSGLRSTFIPQVIATGLLPNTLNDLMSQRRRWIYGNMQVLNDYVSVSKPSLSSKPTLSPTQKVPSKPTVPLKPTLSQTSDARSAKSISERSAYVRAHLSQLSAWINFTGFFIFLQVCALLVIGTALLKQNFETALLTPLYAVYASYAIFLFRRLWAYSQDQTPLNKQIDTNHQPSIDAKVRAWLMHINFWELGALTWLPVLWGRTKPFICTPKQKYIQTRRSLWMANMAALPKLLLILNLITALVVAPFSPFYSPVLFVCALTVCALKIAAAKVAMDNFAFTEPKTPRIMTKSQIAMTTVHRQIKPIKSSDITAVFEDKKTINS
ncbi:glycosyltransferase family 2 protein [Psychrobacter sp. B38]|uniref:glycosyltransferase family 2 protein n=1 Tax=Psychrobacter sp. B38 TaxID=3143538 RepID=UPI0032107E64